MKEKIKKLKKDYPELTDLITKFEESMKGKESPDFESAILVAEIINRIKEIDERKNKKIL